MSRSSQNKRLRWPKISESEKKLQGSYNVSRRVSARRPSTQEGCGCLLGSNKPIRRSVLLLQCVVAVGLHIHHPLLSNNLSLRKKIKSFQLNDKQGKCSQDICTPNNHQPVYDQICNKQMNIIFYRITRDIIEIQIQLRTQNIGRQLLRYQLLNIQMRHAEIVHRKKVYAVRCILLLQCVF